MDLQLRIWAWEEQVALGGSTMIGIKDRFGKARARANKVSYLARKNEKAKALYRHWGATSGHIWSRSGGIFTFYG